MYNENIKKRFIKEKEDSTIISPNFILNKFKAIEQTEIELNKDLCDFTTDEIISYYKLSNLTSYESLNVINNLFSQYTQWCLQNSLVKDNQNHYLEMTPSLINKCLNKALIKQRIISKDTLYKWVDSLVNPRDRFVFLCLFEFGRSADFVEISNAEIYDLKGNDLTLCTGRTVKISDKLKEVIHDCVKATTYYAITSDKYSDRDTERTLVNDGSIMKLSFNSNVDASNRSKGRNIYSQIQRNLVFLKVESGMSANDIVDSGKINFIITRAKELGISTYEYIFNPKLLEEVNQQYGCKITRSTFWIKYQEYLEA